MLALVAATCKATERNDGLSGVIEYRVPVVKDKRKIREDVLWEKTNHWLQSTDRVREHGKPVATKRFRSEGR